MRGCWGQYGIDSEGCLFFKSKIVVLRIYVWIIMRSILSRVWLFLALSKSFTCTTEANYTIQDFRDRLFLVIKKRD